MQYFTAEQVYDALIRQGYDKQRASAMAQAIGEERVSSDQVRRGYKALGTEDAELPEGQDGAIHGSNLAPNLAEAGVYAAVAPALAKKWAKKEGAGALSTAGRFLGRNALPPMAANVANMASAALSGTDYYDRASLPQFGADFAGSIIGASYGEKYGARAGAAAKALVERKAAEQAAAKLAAKEAGKQAAKATVAKAAGLGAEKAAAKTAGSAVAKGIVKKLGAKALASAAGRTIGGTLGWAGGPIGSIALGTALGYALPMLLPDGSKAVEDDPGVLIRPKPKQQNTSYAPSPVDNSPMDYYEELNKNYRMYKRPYSTNLLEEA